MSELTQEKISTLVNTFVKMGRRFDFKGADGQLVIALFKHEDGWSLEAFPKYSRELRNASARFPFPDLPSDPDDAAIALAGYLSVKLNNHLKAKKAAKNRSKEVIEKASKAGVEARRKKKNRPIGRDVFFF